MSNESGQITIDYAARVTAGIAHLDEKVPGWADKIDLEILDISDGHCCITAQVAGMLGRRNLWAHGVHLLGLSTGDDSTIKLGMDVESQCMGMPEGYSFTKAYDTLTEIWVRRITKIRAEAPSTSS